jgi:mono/diheme cytochrome c family protein
VSREETPRARIVRLVVLPICLFVGVSAGVFVLAQFTLAEPPPPAATAGVVLGDAYRGQVVFSQNCSACHGATGEGGIGPKLDGNAISLAAASARIENGGGTMPPSLVSGRQKADVLAYLATIFAPEEESG